MGRRQPGEQPSAVDQCLAEGWETALMLQNVDWAAVRAADAAARAQSASSPVQDDTEQRDPADRCHAALVVLAEALTARGLNVVCSGKVLCARNLAADPPDDDPQAWALTPGLSQSVLCRPDDFGRPWLWWVWSSARTADADGGDGLEPLCEAAEIEYAVERIARVIAVPAGGEA